MESTITKNEAIIQEATELKAKLSAIMKAYKPLLQSAERNRLPNAMGEIKTKLKAVLDDVHYTSFRSWDVQSGKGKKKANDALDSFCEKKHAAYSLINRDFQPCAANNWMSIKPNPGRNAPYYVPCSRTMSKEEYRALRQFDRLTESGSIRIGSNALKRGNASVYCSYNPSILVTEKDEGHLLVQVWIKEIRTILYYGDKEGEDSRREFTYKPQKTLFLTLPKNYLVAYIVYWGKHTKVWGPVEEWVENARFNLYHVDNEKFNED